jgi:hypothetical protein
MCLHAEIGPTCVNAYWVCAGVMAEVSSTGQFVLCDLLMECGYAVHPIHYRDGMSK